MERRLAAILAADVVGYSRLMAADEAGTFARLKTLRTDFIELQIADHHGRVVKLMGDGALVEFASVVDAVECAAAIQSGVAERQAELPEDQRIAFRIGINIGDIIIDGDDIHGDGVNVAARLEALAESGGICVSRTVRDYAQDKLPYGFQDLGEQQVKNIPRPVHVFRVVPDGGAVAGPSGTRRIDNRWLWAAAAAVVLLLGAGGAWLWPRSNDRAPADTQKEIADETPLDRYRIAVLPFSNISADPEDEYFSDGMTEEVISKLSRLHDLTVIARTSIMQYKETGKSIAEIGRELRVGTILEGSVRKAGDRLRISAQLVDVASQGHLWSQDYDRTLEDVFAIQSDVAQKVADTLQLTLMPREKQSIEGRETTDLQAYNLYLKGVYHWHKYTKENVEKARTYFEQAIERDPAYAQAYAWLAFAHQTLGELGYVPPNEAYPKAKSAALRALEIDPATSDAYSILAVILGFYDWDWERSENAYKRALELNPNSLIAHWQYGVLLLTPLGRHDEAIYELKRAIELAPLEPWILADLAGALNYAGRYEQAIEPSLNAVELDPRFPLAHRNLGLSYAQLGRNEAALAEARTYAELAEGNAMALAFLGWVYSVVGQEHEARSVLDQLEARAAREYVDPLALAWVDSGLNDKDAAFEWLEKAYEEKSSWLIFLKVQPYYEALRADPRFSDLLRRIGLIPISN